MEKEKYKKFIIVWSITTGALALLLAILNLFSGCSNDCNVSVSRSTVRKVDTVFVSDTCRCPKRDSCDNDHHKRRGHK